MDTKDKIIKAYKKLLNSKDHDKFTVLDICKEANVSSKGTFYHYFNSKTDLLILLTKELNEYTGEQIDKLSNEHISKQERIYKFIDFCIEVLIKEKDLIVEMLKQMEINDRMKLLNESQQKILKQISNCIYGEVTDETVYKTRLILSIIMQFGNEEILGKNITVDTVTLERKKEILYRSVINMIEVI